jgi:hypothetical protein
MDLLPERCRHVFPRSRKLHGVTPTDAQVSNVVMRLRQIFTEQELQHMDALALTRQVERVWPIAQYVDHRD